MQSFVVGQLTVFFDCPFWVGVFEVTCDHTFRICRVVFGSSEPKDYEVYQYINERYYALNFIAASQDDTTLRPKPINPKRLQRQINRQLLVQGVSTKSYDTIRAGYEAHKVERKRERTQQKKSRKDRLFQMKQQKKLEKRKGH